MAAATPHPFRRHARLVLAWLAVAVLALGPFGPPDRPGPVLPVGLYGPGDVCVSPSGDGADHPAEHACCWWMGGHTIAAPPGQPFQHQPPSRVAAVVFPAAMAGGPAGAIFAANRARAPPALSLKPS